MKIIEIENSNLEILKKFLNSLNEEKENFKYFENRKLSAIENHIYTMILLENDNPVAYGHLDKENDKIWLGIVILKEYQNMGYGKKIMEHLISVAREKSIKLINLSVYKNNESAIRLYEKFNFRKTNSNDSSYFYEKIMF